MKLILDHADALRIVARAAAVSDRKSTLPILAMVLIEADGDLVRVTGTDLDMMVADECPAVVAEPGAVAVSAAGLHDFIAALQPGSQVCLTHATGADPRLEVVSGRAKVRIPVLPAIDFPTFAAMPPAAVEAALSGKVLDWLLGKVDHAVGREPTRPQLGGVHLHCLDVEGETRLRAVATDGHQLGMAEVAAPQALAAMVPTTIPRGMVVELHRLLADCIDDVELRFSDTLVQVAYGSATITSKVIDAPYPDYIRVVPRNHPHALRVKKVGLEQALKRVRGVQSDRKAAVKLDVKADALRVHAHSFEGGQAEDEIDADADHPIEVGLQTQYLTTALGQLAGEDVIIRYGDAVTALTFHEPEDDRVLLIIMPVRV